MTAEIQQGGKRLGQGKKGETFTVRPVNNTDNETALGMIRDLVESGAARSAELVHFVTPQGHKRTKLKRVQELEEFLEFLSSNKNAEGFIGKHIISSSAEKRRQEFEVETDAILKVAKAFGKDVDKHSTLGAPPFKGRHVFGLVLEPCAEFFVFSKRCGPSLDKYGFVDETVKQFVLDILTGFEAIHKGGIIHGDVKLDNMIYCSDHRTFKLIDWGLAESAQQLKARYMGHRKPKNYGSPMSWYVWGMWRNLSWATYVGYYILKAFSAYRVQDGFKDFLDDAGASFTQYMRKPENMKKTRAALLKEFIWSFDLFNFGVILAVIATNTTAYKLNKRTRAQLLYIATRLTHYDHPEFHLNATTARASVSQLFGRTSKPRR